MRLKRNRLSQYQHRKAIPRKDKEGNSYLEYGDKHPFQAEIWAGGGRLQTEMYGVRLPNIRNLRLDGTYREVSGESSKLSYSVTQKDNAFDITVNDGICLYTDDEPDYKVVAIYPYRFLTLEVEKL